MTKTDDASSAGTGGVCRAGAALAEHISGKRPEPIGCCSVRQTVVVVNTLFVQSLSSLPVVLSGAMGKSVAAPSPVSKPTRWSSSWGMPLTSSPAEEASIEPRSTSRPEAWSSTHSAHIWETRRRSDRNWRPTAATRVSRARCRERLHPSPPADSRSRSCNDGVRN